MKLVILESPYAGVGLAETMRNVEYARECIADSLKRGEAPIASHLLYTQEGILDDGKPQERQLGIAAGHAWYKVAQLCVVYTDRGTSPGMSKGVEMALAHGVEVVYRHLPEKKNV